jgi:hypothetical protein
MTPEGVAAFLKWDAETGEVLVNVGLPSNEAAALERAVIAWADNPTKKARGEILERWGPPDSPGALL